jgi:signal transduction histidine kinase
MQISSYTIYIWLTAILIGSLGLVIFIGSKKLSSRAFAFNISLIVLWSISTGLMQVFIDPAVENVVAKLCYYLGGTIAASFFYFCKTFPEDQKPPKKILYLLLFMELIFFPPIYFGSGLIIGNSFTISGIWGWGQIYGPLWFLFDGFFLFFWISGVVTLYSKFQHMGIGKLKTNLGYMIIGLLVGFIPPTIVNIILPRLGYFDLNWLGPVSGSIWVIIIAYSIAKYRQMDVRVAATKVFVIAMVMMALLNIFIDFVFGIYGRVALLIAFAVLGYFLFKSLTREAKQKDQLSSLNSTLSQKVAEQTAEVRKAYELEKHARRDLEKLNETKDQFIMITQHHLRTPVTSIRWELESMLNGTYGRVGAMLKQALNDTNTSVARLTRIVDDFLNITALKVGSQILNIEPGNLEPLVLDVLHELKIDIENMKLSVDCPKDRASWPDLEIDAGKMREVLLIIIENAVRYNVTSGNINITNNSSDNVFEMTIENTGVGLTTEDKEKLFTRHFFRSKRAQAANPIGMGIGLSVARAVVRAHHGDLMIESAGENMGAKVVIRMKVGRS